MERAAKRRGPQRRAVVRALALMLVGHLSIGPLLASTIFVNITNNTGNENGTAAHPYNTIAEGLAVATPGDTVQVAAGTYPEAVTIPDGVTLSGAGQNTTTINATGKGKSAVTMTGTGLAPRTVLRGFTIRGGAGTDLFGNPVFNTDAIGGGGVLLSGDGLVENNRITANNLAGTRPNFFGAGIYVTTGEPTITGNLITANNAAQTNAGTDLYNQTYAIGGGIFVGFFSRPLITKNTISANTARGTAGNTFSLGFGGGIAVYAGEPLPTRIDANLIADNIASDFSGGINVGTTTVGSSHSVITNNVIVGNQADRFDGTPQDSYGGGAYFYYADVIFTNNTVVGNTSDFGAGIMLGYTYPTEASPGLTNTVTITNNIIASNTAVGGGGGVYMEESPTVFSANDVFSNTPNNYQPLVEDRTGTNGNVAVDPQFVNAATRNFHLPASSPVIDEGVNNGAPAFDFDGTNRPIDGDGDQIPRVDMGAFEFSAGVDGDTDGIPDSFDNCPDIANVNQLDTDADEIGNVCDNCPSNYNPDQLDTDGDGIADGCDVCPAISNPIQEDADFDGYGNPCDSCPMAYNNPQTDFDFDGVGDDCDNCPTDSNPDQANPDGDFNGSACDSDDDNDGALDVSDCAPSDRAATIFPPEVPNTLLATGIASTTVDWEGVAQTQTYDLYRGAAPTPNPFAYTHTCLANGLLPTVFTDPADPPNQTIFYFLAVGHNICGSGSAGSASVTPPGQRPLPSACPASTADADGDSVLDIRDRCPLVPDPSQADTDQDGVGSSCDNCPHAPNISQSNVDADTWGDACDADADNDGLPNGSDPNPLVPNGPTVPRAVGPNLRYVTPAGTQLVWDPVTGATNYALYRMTRVKGTPFTYGFTCQSSPLVTTTAPTVANPPNDTVWAYLVTARAGGRESSPGQATSGTQVPLPAPCPP